MTAPNLPARLQPIVDTKHPRHSDAEIARRRDALTFAMQAQELEHCIVQGANRSGSAVR